MVLGRCAATAQPLPVRYACLVHDLGKGTTPASVLPRHIGHEDRSADLARVFGERLRVPTECTELALVNAREHTQVHRCLDLGPRATMRLLERCDALRRPQRFLQMLAACECDATGRLGLEDKPYPQRARLTHALDVVQQVDARAVASAAMAQGREGPAIAETIRRARIDALAAALPGARDDDDEPGEPESTNRGAN
jgi:tRNA nucleotidyltransferase (CCA-adding enzyme)